MDRVAMTKVVTLGSAIAIACALATATRAQGQSETASTLPELSPGEGWQERATTVPKNGAARAWSDPAAGCHLAIFAVPAGENAGVEPMRAALDKAVAKANLTTSDDESGWIRMAGDGANGLASLRIASSPKRSAQLLACYWNEREPARCQARCQQTLQTQTERAE